jgi:hypothetical protein
VFFRGGFAALNSNRGGELFTGKLGTMDAKHRASCNVFLKMCEFEGLLFEWRQKNAETVDEKRLP